MNNNRNLCDPDTCPHCVTLSGEAIQHVADWYRVRNIPDVKVQPAQPRTAEQRKAFFKKRGNSSR